MKGPFQLVYKVSQPSAMAVVPSHCKYPFIWTETVSFHMGNFAAILRQNHIYGLTPLGCYDNAIDNTMRNNVSILSHFLLWHIISPLLPAC